MRPSGYEAKLGEVLIPSGTKLTPAIIGVAAGAGHDVLPVFKKSFDIMFSASASLTIVSILFKPF